MWKQVREGLLTKDGLERCAAALERIATALEQHLPPVEPEEVRPLQAEDYQPASDAESYAQEIYKIIEQKEGPFDPEKEARVRAFIRAQYNL